MLIVAGAAVNTANNLLYLFLVLLLALYPLSWILSRRVVRKWDVNLVLPPTLKAGEKSSGALLLKARKKIAAAPPMAVNVHIGPGTSRTVLQLTKARSDPSEIVLNPVRRGVWDLAVDLECPYPFGLLITHRRVSTREVLVLPQAIDPERDPRGGEGRSGDAVELRKGQGIDLLGIREYQPGEDARYLDWKATARLDKPMVREHAREGERQVVILLDSALPRGRTRLLAKRGHFTRSRGGPREGSSGF